MSDITQSTTSRLQSCYWRLQAWLEQMRQSRKINERSIRLDQRIFWLRQRQNNDRVLYRGVPSYQLRIVFTAACRNITAAHTALRISAQSDSLEESARLLDDCQEYIESATAYLNEAAKHYQNAKASMSH